jgi:hypothetical protein
MNRKIFSAVLLASLAACTAERAPVAAEPQPAPVTDQPAEDVPPATAPAAMQIEPGIATDGVAQDGGPDGDRDLARFDGYGDVRFGTAAADMERVWGGRLTTLGKEGNESCYFMTPTWVKVPAEFNFMIGDGRFARFGTESDKFTAPGGGRVGMTRGEIAKRYAGRVEEQPHKYTDGQYLRITDPAGGDGVLIFETDGKDDAATVTEWRVGVAPPVDYVEGCS